MRKSLKVLSALLTYPSAQLQAAVPEMRAALDVEARLPHKHRDRIDRILCELAAGDLFELQERYVLLFDRTRTLSLNLFEHVHGERRDRGQAMVDLKGLYAQHGLTMIATDLPDHLPLFLEFLSEIPETKAQELIAQVSHILEAIRLRLKKRKVSYSSVFSCVQVLAQAKAQDSVVNALLGEPDEDPNDLVLLDAAWEEEEVRFGAGAVTTSQCNKADVIAKVRAARRPAPNSPATVSKRPIVTYSRSSRA